METMLVKQGITTFTQETDINPFDQVYITIQAGSKEGSDFSQTLSLQESDEMSLLTNSMQDNIYHILNKGFLEESFTRFLSNKDATATEYMEAVFSFLVTIEENLNKQNLPSIKKN